MSLKNKLLKNISHLESQIEDINITLNGGPDGCSVPSKVEKSILKHARTMKRGQLVKMNKFMEIDAVSDDLADI